MQRFVTILFSDKASASPRSLEFKRRFTGSQHNQEDLYSRNQAIRLGGWERPILAFSTFISFSCVGLIGLLIFEALDEYSYRVVPTSTKHVEESRPATVQPACLNRFAKGILCNTVEADITDASLRFTPKISGQVTWRLSWKAQNNAVASTWLYKTGAVMC